MLRIVTGPFCPDLEEALVEEVRQLKAADPLIPVALVVPSTPLVTRLRELLVIEANLCLLNVHFLTFHQFARHLYEEQRADPTATEAGPGIDLLPEFFFEHLVGRLAQQALSDEVATPLNTVGPGGTAALWRTIRDLKDAALDPAVAWRAVEEGLFDSDDAQRLAALFVLYAALLDKSRALGAGMPDDLASAVVPWVPASRFLAGLRLVCYYGFYDLTQVQLSLLEAVAGQAPVTVYFPLADHPAFLFARRFFERHLHPLVKTAEQIVRTPRGIPSLSGRSTEPAAVQVMSAVGPDDELTLVGKQILTLVETHGYRFDEIGVVARSLEPYQGSLRRIFTEHRIPFTTTAQAPVVQEPAAKAILQLASLPLIDFHRTAVLDVLASPFYRDAGRGETGAERRPDQWHVAVRALGITRGEGDWKRLASSGRVEAWVGDGEESDEDLVARVGVDAPQLRVLWALVRQLMAACRALPAHGTYTELTDAFHALALRHVALPGLSDVGREDGEADDRLTAVGSAIRDCLAQLRRLDRAGGTTTYADWVRAFSRVMGQSMLPISAFDHPGVRVLDAMAARGLPFRALFLLGLNEKAFPRFIREDAFLRDRHRRVLEATLGYKIDEKLGGYDEEQLLFTLLRQAARSRLYLLYQRADSGGRPLAPSPYLSEFLGAGREPARALEIRLPRRPAERADMPLFAPALLTHEEFGLRVLIEGGDPSPLLRAAGREALLFQNGWTALRMIEGDTPESYPYDGVTGPLEGYWRTLTERGLSPTPLEQYAQCPFRYFAAQVLRLEPVRQSVPEELPPQALGYLCHAVLRLCYERLTAAGWPERPPTDESVRKAIGTAAQEVFNTYAEVRGAGYALTWQIVQETIVDLVAAAVQADGEEYRQSGFRPIGFEVEAQGTLEGIGDTEPISLKVRGRLDRVDERGTPPGLRVIDYKFRPGRVMKAKDRDLVASAVRGIYLQPPLYALLEVADRSGGREDEAPRSRLPEEVAFEFLAPRWERVVDRSGFDTAAWQGPSGRQLKQTLRTLIDGLRAGRFFILPGDYCDHCEFSAACRRLHGPTWWRAHRASPVRQFRRRRKQTVTRE